jgi:hypothetical protein
VVKQDWNFLPQLVFRLRVGDGHLRPMRLQKQRRGDARPAKPNHQNAFVVEIQDFTTETQDDRNPSSFPQIYADKRGSELPLFQSALIRVIRRGKECLRCW